MKSNLIFSCAETTSHRLLLSLIHASYLRRKFDIPSQTVRAKFGNCKSEEHMAPDHCNMFNTNCPMHMQNAAFNDQGMTGLDENLRKNERYKLQAISI